MSSFLLRKIECCVLKAVPEMDCISISPLSFESSRPLVRYLLRDDCDFREIYEAANAVIARELAAVLAAPVKVWSYYLDQGICTVELVKEGAICD